MSGISLNLLGKVPRLLNKLKKIWREM